MIRKPRSSSQRRRPRANPSEATKSKICNFFMKLTFFLAKSQNLKKSLRVISPRRSPPRTSADDHDADHASQKVSYHVIITHFQFLFISAQKKLSPFFFQFSSRFLTFHSSLMASILASSELGTSGTLKIADFLGTFGFSKAKIFEKICKF